MEMKEVLFHGNRMMAHRLVFTDREGISYSDNQDGIPYVTTTVGREYFEPGDWLAKTMDGAVERVYKAKDFDPHMKEVEVAGTVEEDAGAGDDGEDGGGDIHRTGEPRHGDGSVRVDDDAPETLGKTPDARRRGAAQRRAGDHRRNAGGSKRKSQRVVKAHVRDRARKARGSGLTGGEGT